MEQHKGITIKLKDDKSKSRERYKRKKILYEQDKIVEEKINLSEGLLHFGATDNSIELEN